MKSAVTLSLVPEARGGPFVLWDDVRNACRIAAEMGFDAIEVFPPSADALAQSELLSILSDHKLTLAAVGTGAGWVKQQLTFTSSDPDVRQRALQFASDIVEAAGRHGAPAIIGSMQGRWAGGVTREQALDYLREALQLLARRGARHGTPLIYEPLNRYETNLVNTLADGAQLLKSLSAPNVRLLADLFHMNIEVADIAEELRAAGDLVGHVHIADSNRRPAGYGHTDLAPIAAALRDISYDGYISAECLPYPDSEQAARATIDAFNRHFRS